MSTLRNFHLIWSLRAAGVLALAFMLALSGFTPVFAEEGEESSSEESAPEESAPSPAPVVYCGSVPCDELPPAEERGDLSTESGYTPPAEAMEGLGAWAVVSPSTGEVYSVSPMDGRVWSRDFIEGWESRNSSRYCSDCTLRFQGSASDSGNVAGYGSGSARYNGDSSATFQVGSGASTSTLNPDRTFGHNGNYGPALTDIRTDNTFRSGDTSANVRTYRSDYQDPTVDATLGLPDLGESGSLLTYEMETRTSESSERPSALDQISLDVDSLLMENGYVVTDIIIDEETGEETTTQTVDSENTFVAAIRDVAQSVVEFLSSLLGFGRD